MGVAYFGIYLNTWTYLALLLFALIVFLVIMIATEKQRQRRHKRENIKLAHSKDIQRRMH